MLFGKYIRLKTGPISPFVPDHKVLNAFFHFRVGIYLFLIRFKILFNIIYLCVHPC